MRIGINVPNELLKRLEPLKPELNISQVCREALEAKVERYEWMTDSLGSQPVQAVVDRQWEREKEFRQVFAIDWEMLGYEDAAAWVAEASDDELDDLFGDFEECEERNLPLSKVLLPYEGLDRFTDRQRELSDKQKQLEQENRDLYFLFLRRGVRMHSAVPDQNAYMAAWITYTSEVWKLVNQRQQDYLDRLREERPAPPRPEVPEGYWRRLMGQGDEDGG